MKYWYRILEILFLYEPVFCGCCGKLEFRKETVRKLTLTGHWSNVCNSCISEYWSPNDARK